MEDWTTQSVIVLILGTAGTIGLWAAFLWTLTRDDSKK